MGPTAGVSGLMQVVVALMTSGLRDQDLAQR
jgi:hypothetical protein